jgi:hypothetical protein
MPSADTCPTVLSEGARLEVSRTGSSHLSCAGQSSVCFSVAISSRCMIASRTPAALKSAMAKISASNPTLEPLGGRPVEFLDLGKQGVRLRKRAAAAEPASASSWFRPPKGLPPKKTHQGVLRRPGRLGTKAHIMSWSLTVPTT